MKTKWQNFLFVIKTAFSEWSEDKVPRLAAALAYYTIFSLAPFLMIIIIATGMIIGRSTARTEIINQVRDLVGPQGADAITVMIEGANEPSEGGLTAVISLLVLIFASTGLFTQLHDALNTIWEVQPKRLGIVGMLRERFFAFAIVMSVAFLLLVSLTISAVLAAFDRYMTGLFPGAGLVLQVANVLISFGVITLLFALIFKYLPEAKITWSDVLPGAAITALLFTVGKLLIGLYLGNSGVTSAYGTAGSLVVVLLWVYYSSMILFFGAEVTQVYARQSGEGIRPEPGASLLAEEARRQQGIPHQPELDSLSALPASKPVAPAVWIESADRQELSARRGENPAANQAMVALGAIAAVLVGFISGAFVGRK